MTKLCICMICTCGRHKCPHFPRGNISKDKLCTITEYANKYKQHPMELTRSCKPADVPHQYSGPLQEETTNRVDYIKHPMAARWVKQQDVYQKPEGAFEGTTNYTKDYPMKRGETVRPIKRDQSRKVLGKFEGTPTYQTDFRKWDVAPREMAMRNEGYAPNEAPFDGTPTYVTDYIKHPMALRSSMKPAEAAKMSNAQFEDKTGYRDEYVKHPMEERFKKEKAVYAPNPAKLEGLSNYMKDYTAKEGAKMNSCKPDQNPYQSDAPFAGETTNRHDYTRKEGDRPHVHQPDMYVKPDGDMQLNTTSHTDYVPKKIDRQRALKPSNAKRAPGEFHGVTNYNVDFKEWPAGERQKMTMKSEYAPPDAPFAGTPTYQRDYIKHPHAMRGSMKPNEAAKASDAPFEDRTGYRDEFIKHPLGEKHKREVAAWAPNPAKLEGLSNYMKDFIPKESGKLPSCKPDSNPYQSSAPFEGETTNRHDYTKKSGDRPHVHQHEEYVKPDGDMLLNTTSHTDYAPKAGERTQIRRPPSTKRAPGKFYGQTNYSTDFRKLSAERVRFTPKNDYKPNEAPFEGQPTYQSDFIKYKSAPTRSMKPSDAGYSSGAPFEGSTEYTNEYIKKAAPPCPVTIINSGGNAGYMFDAQDDVGHKWYEQTPRIEQSTRWETKSTGALSTQQPLIQLAA